MLKLDLWTLFFTICNVLILFLAFKKFLIAPIMDIIEKRDAMIRQQFESANEANLEADTRKKEFEQQLQTAHIKAAEIITNARERANEERNQILAQTEKDARKMLAQARADINYEQEKAKAELTSQIADIAMLAARKIIRTGEMHDTGSN